MPAVGEAGSEQDRTIDDLWRYPPLRPALQKGLHCHEGLLIDDRRHFVIDPLGGRTLAFSGGIGPIELMSAGMGDGRGMHLARGCRSSVCRKAVLFEPACTGAINCTKLVYLRCL